MRVLLIEDEPSIFICKLRKKIDLASGGENYIETIWGRGDVPRDPEASELRAA